MPLKRPTPGGDFSPFIRFMASTSTWEMSADGSTAPFNFTQAIADLENLKTGWGLMGEGQAPQWEWDDDRDNPAMTAPGEGEWKPGLSVRFYAPKLFGDDDPVRDLSSTGTGVCMGLEALFNEYEASAANNPGKVPVVKYEGAERKKVGKGNTSVPLLKIVKWVDRPDALAGEDSASPAAPSAPAEEPAASTAPADDEEF